jgi:predicted cupin superfamily sugar epimerase
MTGNPDIHRIVTLLGLERHRTCGFMGQTFQSPHRVGKESLPAGFDTPRALGAALYFLISPEWPAALHSIRSDQMYHHYLGDPLEVLLLYPDGGGEVRTLGNDLQAGHRPQLLIPGGTLHISRNRGGQGFALLATTSWLGVEPQDVVNGRPEELLARYPAMRDAILDFTATAPPPRQ